MICNSNFNNYQNRQTPSFSGKSFVQMNCLCEKYLVPRKVADVRRSVKCAFAKDKFVEGRISVANAINVENNLFLGIAHLFEGIKEVSLVAIGKFNNKGKRVSNLVSQHIEKNEIDFSLLKVEMEKGCTVAKSNPVKFTQNAPKRGETVYIVGYHMDFKGPKAIPVKYEGFVSSKNGGISCKANCIKVESDFLKDKVNPHGLSGAAVVNKDGELVGVLTVAGFHRKNKLSNGSFYGISVL